MDLLVHDQPRAGRALLPLEAERRGDDAARPPRRGPRLVDDDGVLAAHLQHRALDPDLPGQRSARLLGDLEPDLARAGEGDEARLRVLDERVADRRAAAGARSSGRRRECPPPPPPRELRRDGRRVGRGLQHDGVAGRRARRSSCPPGSRAGSSTGGMTAPTPSGMYSSSFFSPGYGRQRLGLREPQHLAGVELAEVDRLGGVAVGLGPGLGLLEHHHRGELVLALAQDRGDAQDEGRALRGGHAAPAGEGLRRGVEARSASAVVPCGKRPMTCFGSQGLTDSKSSRRRSVLPPMRFFPCDREPASRSSAAPRERRCGWPRRRNPSGARFEIRGAKRTSGGRNLSKTAGRKSRGEPRAPRRELRFTMGHP